MRRKLFKLGMLASCLLGVWISTTFFTVYRVAGVSMEPTFHDKDRILVRNGGEFEHQDIVVFKKKDKKLLIKRVIGKEGDRVEIRHGHLFVNSELIEEECGCEDNLWVVPEDCIFVLGDNRGNSIDSRDPDVGFVEESSILGVVLSR